MYVKYKLYVWHGINIDGVKCNGQIMAQSKSDVRNILRNREIVLRKISQDISVFAFLNVQYINNKDLVKFTQQVAVILDSGFSFLQALQFASQYLSNSNFRRLMRLIIIDVESGMSFAKSIQMHKSIFSPLYRSLIEVGENGGNLVKIFLRLTDYLKQIEEFKNNIYKILFYPALLIIFAMLIIVCILLVVMPQLQTLYSSFGSELPWASKFLLKTADVVKNYALYLLVLFLSFFVFCKWLYSVSNKVAIFYDKFILKIPLIGAIIRKIILAKFINILYISYVSGLSLIESLKHAKLAANNSCYTECIEKIIVKVSVGFSLQKSLDDTAFFPEHLINILKVGDEISSLEEILRYLSTFYDKEVDSLLVKISKALEPIVMLFLGGLIGFLVFAIYYPIINLGATL